MKTVLLVGGPADGQHVTIPPKATECFVTEFVGEATDGRPILKQTFYYPDPQPSENVPQIWRAFKADD